MIPVRVVVVSAVRLYREGLVRLLEQCSDLEVVGAAATLDDVSDGCASDPCLVLLDMTSVDLRDLRTRLNPGIGGRGLKLVALGVPATDEDIIACAEAGVAGYVSRDGSLTELVGTIKGAIRGEFQCPARITGTLVRRMAALARDAESHGPPTTALTRREFQVVELIDRGLSNKQIARELGIELSTTKNHVHNLLEKLEVRSRREAAARVRWSTAYGRTT